MFHFSSIVYVWKSELRGRIVQIEDESVIAQLCVYFSFVVVCLCVSAPFVCVCPLTIDLRVIYGALKLSRLFHLNNKNNNKCVCVTRVPMPRVVYVCSESKTLDGAWVRTSVTLGRGLEVGNYQLNTNRKRGLN